MQRAASSGGADWPASKLIFPKSVGSLSLISRIEKGIASFETSQERDLVEIAVHSRDEAEEAFEIEIPGVHLKLLRLEDKVYIVSLPKSPHGNLVTELCSLVRNYIVENSNGQAVTTGDQAVGQKESGSNYNPDVVVLARHHVEGPTKPRFILEVEIENRSPMRMRNEFYPYFDREAGENGESFVQGVLGFKFYHHGDGHFSAAAVMWQRSSAGRPEPSFAVDFGPDPLHATVMDHFAEDMDAAARDYLPPFPIQMWVRAPFTPDSSHVIDIPAEVILYRMGANVGVLPPLRIDLHELIRRSGIAAGGEVPPLEPVAKKGGASEDKAAVGLRGNASGRLLVRDQS